MSAGHGEGEGDGLTLDAEHVYRFAGRRVAGVTEILQGVGIVDATWFKEWHAQRGTAVHKAMELLVQGRLDWATVDPRIEGYVRSGLWFCETVGIAIGDPTALTEYLVWNSVHRYAGKLDAMLRLVAKLDAVVDWKSGAHGAANLQTAAYAEALKDELGTTRTFKRMSVQLQFDGSPPKVIEYKSSRDFGVFSAAALIFNDYHLPRLKETAA